MFDRMIEMSGSDEQEFIEWIKSKAESVKEANIYESKSWLLTGTSIFPNNISLKMVSYMTSKQDKNVALSSITLTSMLNNPENDSNVELQEEVNSLLKSMLSDCTSPEDKINSDIFKCIPKDMQANILKKAALECQDVIMKCSLLLLLIKTNSFYAREYGLMLVEALFEAEIKDSPNNRNNVYRRYFANDALPLLLSENSAATEKKILLSWLDKAFQYYIIIAFQSGKEG
ncbi:INTS10 [Bugula neritina]|uniref:Integrator complex subunit 10 n=1 Tax=Bugula neritina TaxID=10212 RepID=A0A7J7IUK2_BUGNE|nr:INTS10 [Bugula neritina]